MDILVNNNSLKNDNLKFWDCGNCYNYGFNYNDEMLYCHLNQGFQTETNFSFYFNISSLEQLDFNTSEYHYYFNNTNYIYISSLDFNNAINLIDLHSINILYVKNSEGKIITPFYKYIYYKLSFDVFKTHKGKFIGSDESNNDLELDENTYSRIFENKNLRYELSDEEKNNRGVHLKLKIGIYNNKKKLISELQDFNFIICLQYYLSCDFRISNNWSCELKELEINEDLEIKKAQEIKAQDKLLEYIEKDFTSENYDTSELDKGNDAVTKTEKMTITLTIIKKIQKMILHQKLI